MRQKLVLIPKLGIILSLILYFYAADLYPGGQAFNKSAVGYSHINNFWCDLLDHVTYSGLPNPARPYALTATIILAFSFLFFWFNIPILFLKQNYLAKLVQVCGCLAMIFVSFIFTPYHNSAILFAAAFGFLAFFTTQWGLFKSGERRLLLISILAIIFLMTNFLMWQTEFELPLMARIQKAAFVSFFVWVWSSSTRIYLRLNRESIPPHQPQNLSASRP
jgi:hypothetical protein